MKQNKPTQLECFRITDNLNYKETNVQLQINDLLFCREIPRSHWPTQLNDKDLYVIHHRETGTLVRIFNTLDLQSNLIQVRIFNKDSRERLIYMEPLDSIYKVIHIRRSAKT